jgi:carbamoyltransferase
LHNFGVALIEISRERGPVIVCNNGDERFSAKKHSTEFHDRRGGAAVRRLAPRCGGRREMARFRRWLTQWQAETRERAAVLQS